MLHVKSKVFNNQTHSLETRMEAPTVYRPGTAFSTLCGHFSLHLCQTLTPESRTNTHTSSLYFVFCWVFFAVVNLIIRNFVAALRSPCIWLCFRVVFLVDVLQVEMATLRPIRNTECLQASGEYIVLAFEHRHCALPTTTSGNGTKI